MELCDVLSDLKAREPIFHRRQFGTTREALEAMIAEDVCEVGASGRICAPEEVIETLPARYAAGPGSHDWPCRGFGIMAMGDDYYLLAYRLDEPECPTRRATLRTRAGAGWQIVYRQGTEIQP